MMLLEDAEALAEELVAELMGDCERIEIAGSIRRQAEHIKDIEIVCVPTPGVDMFGDPLPEAHDVGVRFANIGGRARRRSNGSRIAWGGARYFAGLWHNVPVDVFCVLPPAQWGVLMTIRTGPADFSKMLVTQALNRGGKVENGQLFNNAGELVETPEERDFFFALGFDYVEPWERT